MTSPTTDHRYRLLRAELPTERAHAAHRGPAPEDAARKMQPQRRAAPAGAERLRALLPLMADVVRAETELRRASRALEEAVHATASREGVV